MSQPPNGPWSQPSAPPLYGNPQQFGYGPGPGPGQPGTQPIYGQPGAPQPGHGQPSYGAPNPMVELQGLKDDANLWLLVVAVGFWLGFGWVTGPLGWYFGSQVRGKYRALGHHPCPAANWAWGLGIASTMITYLVALSVIAFFVFLFAGFAAAM